MLTTNTSHDGQENDADAEKWLQEQTEKTHAVHTKNHGIPGGEWVIGAFGTESAELIFGENLPRLQQVKAAYDPDNVFRSFLNIKPAVLADGKL